MGLKEPEVFVQFAGKLGKEIGSNGVAEVGGFLDGGAHGVRVMRDVMDQELEHRRTIRAERSASFKVDLAAVSRAVPLATPPSVVMRSAIVSVWSRR